MASLSIRSSTIRLGIFISTLIITTIVIFQLIWLKKIYTYEEKEFDHSILKVIRGLYEDLDVKEYNNSPLNELIEHPEQHLYLAHIQLPVNKDTVFTYLQYELEDFAVFTNCQVGIYNASLNKYETIEILTAAGTKEKGTSQLPVWKKNVDYIALYFPNRSYYILSQMNFWIISCIILLVLLLLFGAGLYYFYRQKFLNEIQKDFTHNFTHEFKTPVAVISLAADVLSDESILEKPAKLATYAGIVKYQATHLQNQIEKLLQFAYTESHQLRLTLEEVNIHELIYEAAKNLDPLINEREVLLHYGLQATSPIVRADRNYLLIVIISLMENAIKYSKEPHVSVATRDGKKSLTFSISDNGIGIPKKEIKKIFLKFYRATNDDTYTTKGFGLGLSFVKMILDAHGGKIKVESTPGKGSIFSFELPG
jgi:two-component system, OmpR family, phosphate regulon sensor histidine kinase PhoR